MQRTTTTQKTLQQCIQECHECHASCLQTLQYCIQQGGKHVELDHIRLMQDCSQMCQMCEDFMLRQSPLYAALCTLCAQICLRCAESCEKVDPNDAQMKACAEHCHRCAQTCQQMSQGRA
ncbi:hypothetical protein EI42_01323 [Thermosporothrix hazakensis]|uniref:Ferredoxin n=2 Tax=Thermosporothrix TaxID=768650 RepID=A0A326UB54_THEHA|nr:four-helix bundle copper-binding protein [Thermosporothrix hazakensis]PZW34486.1 hypothetical protein EI42_01323 [Thermosporothrix hazakensis]BBH85607.1 ferredoxin [Thermosporothrix sp. COM3]GCE45964.1 ferredoxin [Thermosporothrix hazakensis]